MQECICSCNATAPPGLFQTPIVSCLGANDGNAFTALAFSDRPLSGAGSVTGGKWTMEQNSIAGNLSGFNYHATFDFGATAGGSHTATGHSLTTASRAATTTQFWARQSAIGCAQGSGVAVCLPLCEKYGIPTAQLRRKCNLKTDDSL